MKQILYFILFINFSISYSQEFNFAVINDKEGFVNIRSSNEVKDNNIVDKLENGYVVTHFEAEGNWILVEYQKNGKLLDGYVYKDRINNISNFIKIPEKQISPNGITLSNKDIEIIITEKNFDKTKHTFNYFNNDPNIVIQIDGKDIFGTDGNIPKREYNFIEIQIGAIHISLPKNALENLYEPTLENTIANYDEKSETLYIQSSNSDGAGGYEIIWVIEKGKYKERIVTNPY